MRTDLIFPLLVIYQLKHWIADYPLQSKYMLGKFKPGWDFLGPLVAHSAVHAAMTLGILAAYGRLDLYWLALVDFLAHFAMDRIKAGPKYMGRWKALSSREYVKWATQKEVWERFEKPLNPEIAIAMKSLEKRFRDNVLFWWALGIDQAWHHLTHYFIIWGIVCM